MSGGFRVLYPVIDFVQGILLSFIR
jgi:hypothetical protein